jgi:predicted enzyme related to lactoylglutathione lyase
VHVGVSSVDETLEKVRDAGGEVVSPKSDVPGVGYAAYCRDSEGNAIGIFQADPEAA